MPAARSQWPEANIMEETNIEHKPLRTFVDVQNEAIQVIQTVYDPEIPVNIYELGLIYEVNVDAGNNVHVLMTLTSPMCPVAESLPKEVEDKIKLLADVGTVKVEVTFDPAWTQELMSEVAKLELGML
jgi:FeS assembly SUF system protein